MENKNNLAKLTPREIEVAKLTANGFSRKMMESELKISKHTIDVYLKNSHSKTNTKNASGLAAWYIKYFGSGENP